MLTEKKQQAGFTLIELIMVIVVLGILVVVAIPKYADLKREAIISTMHGINGALETAATIVHAKAVIAGVHDQASATLVIDGTSVDLVYGYPAGTATGIVPMLEAPTGDWKQRASVYSGAWVYWHGVIDEDAGAAQCYLRYRQPTGPGLRPVIDFQDTGC